MLQNFWLESTHCYRSFCSVSIETHGANISELLGAKPLSFLKVDGETQVISGLAREVGEGVKQRFFNSQLSVKSFFAHFTLKTKAVEQKLFRKESILSLELSIGGGAA